MRVDYRDELPRASILAHDHQKDFSHGMWERVLDQVELRAPQHEAVLDAGVGSGLIATRLAERGFEVVGVDFNGSMLGALRDRGTDGIHCAMGDVRMLPVRSAAVDAVVITNVLHLLEDWRGAVRDAVRVLRPAGVLFVSLGGGRRSPIASQVDKFFRGLVPTDDPVLLGPRSISELDEAAVGCGMHKGRTIVETEVRPRTIGSMIDRLELNVFTWPPGTAYDALQAAGNQTRAWAEATFGSLESDVDVEVELRLDVYVRDTAARG